LSSIHRLALPTPFPVGAVNAYLLEGKPLTLVDPGPLYPPAREALRAGLARLGYRLRDISCVVITHPHLDHFGAAAEVVEASGAEVLAFPRAARWLEALDGEWVRRADFLRAQFARLGCPHGLTAGLQEGLRRLARWALPVELGRGLEDGERVTLGGTEWTTLHMPGHSSSCLCLYDGRRLLSGDYLLEEISSNALLEPPAEEGGQRHRSLPTYLASLRRGTLLEVEEVFPGHGPPFGQLRAVLERRFEHYRRRKAQVKATLAAAGARGMTGYELCMALFPNLPVSDAFLGLSEVVGHLDLLEAEGCLDLQDEGGVTRYRLRATPRG